VSPASRQSKKPNYPIGSVDSALRLLAELSSGGPLRIADAAERLDVSRSTAHRMMQMLCYHGFAVQDSASKAYSAGPLLIKVGLAAVGNLDFREAAHACIESLRDELEETVLFVGDQNDGGLLVLDSAESRQPLRVGGRSGMILAAHASAAGRALLARLPESRIRELYPREKLPPVQPGTIRRRSELLQELERTEERGFAVQREETEIGVSAVAARVPRPVRAQYFAVVVSLPSARFREDDVPKIGAATVKCAEGIAAVLPT
jgi:IclR family transcriptional regulator, acetate operon repressor